MGDEGVATQGRLHSERAAVRSTAAGVVRWDGRQQQTEGRWMMRGHVSLRVGDCSRRWSWGRAGDRLRVGCGHVVA